MLRQQKHLQGDGTTTATLLAQAIIREGLKNVTAGANPMLLRNGIRMAVEEAVKGITYKVTGKDTVAVVEFDEPKSKLNIPATISFEDDEFTYKVTAINANAFKGESDIKSVTIGANVATIGKNAFSGCKSLKKVTIKSKAIKSIGKKAFKGTAKKITVKSPKAKKAAYKKLLKKAGISKKAKFK